MRRCNIGLDPVKVQVADLSSHPLCVQTSCALATDGLNDKSRQMTTSSPAVRAWEVSALIARYGVTPPNPTTNGCLSADAIDMGQHAVVGRHRLITFNYTPTIEMLRLLQYVP